MSQTFKQYRYEPYKPGNELQQVLSSVVVAAAGDRGTIYRYDESKQAFVRSEDEYVAINTPNKNTKYLSSYPFDPRTNKIDGLCNFYGKALDADKNVETKEGQALYIPIESSNGEKLVIVVEREYFTGEDGKLYHPEEYTGSGPKTEVTEREFHPANIRTATFIAKTWDHYLFPGDKSKAGRDEFRADMENPNYYLSVISQLNAHVREYFGDEMKSHVENVGRMAKMAMMNVVKAPESLKRQSYMRLIPERLTGNLTNMDILYNEWVMHDGGKINNPRRETEWLGHRKSAGESIRSKQHGLFTEILLTLPGLHYGKDVANHHTQRGYYNEYSMISAFVEIADMFDAMTGARTNERYRPQTAIEAMTVIAEIILNYDEEMKKYEPGETPDLRVDKHEVKIPPESVAMLAKAFEAFLEYDVFKIYPKSRKGDFSSWFSDRESGTVARATEETGGVMYDARHTLEHLRENGDYTNNIAKIARRAKIITGQHKYDQYLPPGDLGKPDTYEQVKGKILSCIREKILDRADTRGLLDKEARRQSARPGSRGQQVFEWAR